MQIWKHAGRPLILLLAASLTLAAIAAPRAGAQAPKLPPPVDDALEERPLPSHPDLVTGTLDNGLSYIIKQHQNPPGRASVRLHISSGSLNETDAQRGIAHYLEHMAFNGSKNFPPGELIPFFESLGLTFGRHQNAFTSFDQTVYMLDLPETSEQMLNKGMTFFADVLGRLNLDPEEIENERQVILEERRTGLGPQERITNKVLPRIVPDSRIAERLPIGVEETITSVDQDDFLDYYRKWYTTGNTTLMVIGDIEPETVKPIIEKTFGPLPAEPAREDVDPGSTSYTESFAVVATDPELTTTEVAVLSVGEPRGASTTEADFRRDLVEQVASTIFNRRLQERVNAGDVSFRQGGVFLADLFNAVRFAQAQAVGDIADWESMLTDLITELQRARRFGFSERELEDVRSFLLSRMRQFSMMEDTLPAPSISQIILQSVNEGEPVISFAQRLELMERHLPTITPAEVSEVFAGEWKPGRVAFVLEAPESDAVPSEAELLEVSVDAMNAEVAAAADADRPDTILDELPQPADVAELTLHPPTQVATAEMVDGVTVHHREMDIIENQVNVVITLAGGRVEESESTRGLTQAAVRAFARPAARSRTSTNIRDLLTGTTVNLGGFATTDTVKLSISAAPEDLEAGMQVAHLLLTEPLIEPAAFQQWQQAQIQAIEQRKTQPLAKLGELLPKVVFPEGDPRFPALEAEEVAALDMSRAQQWLDGLIARAPIEVAIVGDIPRESAFELARRYLGSLPPREPISERTLAQARTLPPPDAPPLTEIEIPTQTDQSVVLVAFYGADASDLRDTRLLRVAQQILSTRMIQRVREKEQLVYSIGANHQPAEAFPGYGLFLSAAPTAPEKADTLAAVISEMFTEFADSGPSGDEVEVARGQIINALDEEMEQPSFWSSTLQTLAYRGHSLDDIRAAPTAFESISPEEVHDAFRRYFQKDDILRIIIRPAPSETPDTDSDRD